MLLRIICAVWLILLPLSAWAQDDDKGFLTNLLQDSLGGEGRDVQINGFAGAFSSRATIDSIVVSDDEGVWLRLDQVVVDWNRSALLRGRIEVQELSAEQIDVPRLPVSTDDDLPSAEAQGFSLPELPVSININRLAADRITLGEPVLGEATELTLDAQATLANGEGAVSLTANRTDDKVGQFDIDAAYEADDQQITLALNLSEEEGGVVSRLLNLPDQPSVALQVNGEGPLSDFTAQVALASDGQDRLSGKVSLNAVESTIPGVGPARGFSVDIGGDVTALFAPQYHDFFGDDVQLTASGVRRATGDLTLDTLDLRTQALALQGELALNRDYWPVLMDLEGRLAAPDGTPVVLPISGAQTQVDEASLSVKYDRDAGDAWTAVVDVAGLSRDDITVARTALSAEGMLEGDVNAVGRVSAAVDLITEGVEFADADMAQAVGDTLSGQLSISYVEGEPLQFSDLDLSGADYGLTGGAVINDLDSGFATEFDLDLNASNLTRFSGIAGQELTGAAQVALEGNADLGGAFNIAINGETDNLGLGIEQADAVLSGRTALVLKAHRDTEGTVLDSLDLRNDQLEITASAELQTGASDASFDARLSDAGLIVSGIEGPLNVVGNATQDDAGWRVDVEASGPYNATADIEGLATGPDAAVRFNTTIPDIQSIVPQYSGAVTLDGVARQSPDGWLLDTDLTGPYGLNADVEGRITGTDAPDVAFNANLPNINPLVSQVSGALSVSGRAQQIDGAINVQTTANGPYGLTADVSGTVTGSAPELRYSVRIPNVAPLVSQVNGPLQLDGTARQQGDDWFIDTAVAGPAGTTADVVGTVGTDGQLNMSAAGSAPLALANPFIEPRNLQGQARFDLRLDGPADLSSLSGQVSTSDGRLSAPTYQIALTDIGANIAINQGRANVEVRGAVSTGGSISISGPVTLTGARPAALNIALDSVRVVDPSLYRTTLDGALSVNGNLSGGARIAGRIDVGSTTVNVPSSGLGGFSIIPEIAHVGASSAVRQTQDRAGVNDIDSEEASSTSNAVYPLDILVSAPSRIFVRGRGLDAELGGSLRLTGTTANIISSGRFELIRGQLDILDKRFELDEGNVQLQGDFDPYLRFVATTQTSTGTASVVIEGSASSPDVSFEASPDAPQDEILAQIFFGRDVSQLSAFQALQLANAVATLAGTGGESVVSQLRRSFDLDDLDVTTDTDGNTAVRAGKYISDNVYTDVTVGGSDGAELSINIDLTPSLTARGATTSNGDTSIGIYFERDY